MTPPSALEKQLQKIKNRRKFVQEKKSTCNDPSCSEWGFDTCANCGVYCCKQHAVEFEPYNSMEILFYCQKCYSERDSECCNKCMDSCLDPDSEGCIIL